MLPIAADVVVGLSSPLSRLSGSVAGSSVGRLLGSVSSESTLPRRTFTQRATRLLRSKSSYASS
ncbi:hypothetical protein CRM89_10800 [Nocardia sp. FDAARGOS_372]|nr:hypothetical protein CRM89_10800 [Nocardia sp. FDAARGOS_372]